ncbi:MAG: IS1634 family transposase [Methanoregulaceae archaeon]|nr:IS1634 family transposase [Methanoregulaceae archaeon]
MPVKTESIEYQTTIVGAAYLVKGILTRLRFVSVIDEALRSQPDLETTYGALAQVIVANRLTFQPMPLYKLAEWASEHGLDHVFDLEADWLDDDRLGAMLEGVADHQVTIWSALVKQAIHRFHIDLKDLHADTTSVYFEGAYETEDGSPKGGGDRIPLLVEGYNKDGQRRKVQLVLSLITQGRLPLWYCPWDGNQTDDAVYIADMTALRKAVLIPSNVLLIGDRKLCNEETLVGFCRQHQLFLAAHPWTDTAKSVWRETWQRLQAGQLTWTSVEYASRNKAHKPPEERPAYRVCEIAHPLKDAQAPQGQHTLRWAFVWSSDKAAQDARQRTEAIQAGDATLKRVKTLLGKYDYVSRQTIEARIDQALHKAKASAYFTYTLTGTDENQAWQLRWRRRHAVIEGDANFDGVALLCTNAPPARLSSSEAMIKYKEQVCVEQTIDFLKSPVQIRPMWLHTPKRLAGLTLLIMVATLVAALLEYQVRRWIAKTGQVVKGLRPEGRDDPYPTAKSILRAFQDYALVILRRGKGQAQVRHPKLRPVQQKIWNIMGLPPLPS